MVMAEFRRHLKTSMERLQTDMVDLCYLHRASGLLSGKVTTETKFERNDDVQNRAPRLTRANIAVNQPIIDLLKQCADLKHATSAQK